MSGKNAIKREYKIILARLGMGFAAVALLKGIFTAFILFLSGYVSIIKLNYVVNMSLSVITSFVIPLIVFYAVFNLKNSIYKNYENIKNTESLYKVLPLAAILFFLGSAGSYITELIYGIFGSGMPNVYENMMPGDIFETVVFFTVMAVIAPVFEELVFRKLILNAFRPFGGATAVLISSFCFSLFHFNLSQLLYTFLCGLFLGYTVLIFGAIKASVIIHILYNTVTLILYYADYTFASIANFFLAITGAILSIYIVIKRKKIPKLPSSELKKSELIILAVTSPVFLVGFFIFIFV